MSGRIRRSFGLLPLPPFATAAAIGVGKSIAGSVLSEISGASDAAKTRAASEAKAKKAATEFETMFLEQSLDRMMQSEGTEGPLGENGTGGGVWRSMLTKEYAEQIVKTGGIGVADQVYREMMKLQEAGQAGATNGAA